LQNLYINFVFIVNKIKFIKSIIFMHQENMINIYIIIHKDKLYNNQLYILQNSIILLTDLCNSHISAYNNS